MIQVKVFAKTEGWNALKMREMYLEEERWMTLDLLSSCIAYVNNSTSEQQSWNLVSCHHPL